MSHTSQLYFHCPDAGIAPVLVANSHCDWAGMPSLWRLILTDAEPCPALPIGHAGKRAPAAIEVPGRDAIERVKYLYFFVSHHPLLHRIPELTVYLRSVEDFLLERSRTFTVQQEKTVVLVAQQSDGKAPDPGLLNDMRCDWQVLEQFVAAKEHHGLDDMLGFTASRQSFGQWRSWVKLFGLDTLNHPYFTRLEYSLYSDQYLGAPDATSFQQFVRNGNRASEDAKRSAWSALKGMVQSLGGLRKAPAEPQAPSDDDVRAEEPDSDDDDASDEGPLDRENWFCEAFRKVRVDGKIGLRFIPSEAAAYHTAFDTTDDAHGTDPDALALAAEWDEIRAYSHDRAWARRDRLWGVIDLRRRCSVVMAPCFEKLGEHGACGKGGRYGLVDPRTASWSLPPEYDQMVWRQRGGGSLWHLRQGALWGVADVHGTLKQPCIFDSLASDKSGKHRLERFGWQAMRGGRAGWVNYDGDLDVPCEFDQIAPCDSKHLYAVKRDGRWGLVVKGQQWVPCDYLSVAPLALARNVRQYRHGNMWWHPSSYWESQHELPDALAACDPALVNFIIAVRTENGMGAVDQAHRPLVPCIYKDIAPTQSGMHVDERWLRVTAHDGRQGLWSVAAGAEIFPCEHEWIEVLVGPSVEQPLVGTVRDGRYRIWSLDRTRAFEGSFLWLSADEFNTDGDLDEGVGEYERGPIAQNWRKGKPVRAAQDAGNGDVTLVYLLPGQPVLSEHDSAVLAFMETGDRKAALTLAEGYFEGFHRAKDFEKARLWAGRACGYEPPPATAQRKQYPPYRYVLGGVPPTPAFSALLGASHLPQQAARRERGVAGHNPYFVKVAEVDGEQDPYNDYADADGEGKFDEDLYQDSASLFARMLDQGLGGPRDAPHARHWAQCAAGASGTHDKVYLQVGKLLLDDSAGPIEVAKAYRILEEIDAPSLSEGGACYYRGCCLRIGVNGAPDLEGARVLMVRADACKVALAAPALAELLTTMAATAERETAKLLLGEAAYYAAKAKAAAAGLAAAGK